MKNALLVLGFTGVGIAIYDQIALAVDTSTGTATLPFIWKGTVAGWLSEYWLAIIGIILIMIALFFGV
jgi:hypothetical protein